MLTVLDTLTTLAAVLPADIDISPNDSGLPGIAALRTIVGAVMTIGLILSVLALIISAVVWGFGSNSSGNLHLASRGKVGALISCGAAIITGAWVTLINFFWDVGQTTSPNSPANFRKGGVSLAGICDVPIISNVCDTVGETAATLISAPFDWLAQAIGQAASWLFQGVWARSTSTTLVDLSGAGYIGVYNVIFGIAIFVMLIFLESPTHHRPHSPRLRIPRPRSVGPCPKRARIVPGDHTDHDTAGGRRPALHRSHPGHRNRAGRDRREDRGSRCRAYARSTSPPTGAGAIITIFLSFLAICAAAIVWFSLLIRKALILVAVVMAPIALSGQSVGSRTEEGWFGKWAFFVLALIFSKVVIVVVFLVAINQVNAP